MPEDAKLAIARARDVELLVLDVDGVLTDGGIYVDARGEVTKRFHVHDGLGIKAAQAAGLAVAVISGLDSPAVAARRRELGMVREAVRYILAAKGRLEAAYQWFLG